MIIICNFDRLEIVKSKVEQPAGILILRVVAVQDDGNQCRIALSGTIDQCVEGDGGITGFAAEDVRTVVLRPVLFDQLIARGDALSLGIFLVRRQFIVGCLDDLGKRRIFKCRPRDERHVVGADIVFLVIQTARICKMRILAPKLGGFFIHQNSKCISGASYVLGECVGSLIG